MIQGVPPPVVGWADIPELSTCLGRRPVAWLQSWPEGADPRPFAFRPNISPVGGGSRRALCAGRRSPLLAVGRLLLLSRSPSTRRKPSAAIGPAAMQGMARVRSGQAPAWPLVSGRSVRSGSRVKRDFACTLTGALPPALVALRAQSRLGLEGRTRTLSGPSPDYTHPAAWHSCRRLSSCIIPAWLMPDITSPRLVCIEVFFI